MNDGETKDVMLVMEEIQNRKLTNLGIINDAYLTTTVIENEHEAEKEKLSTSIMTMKQILIQDLIIPQMKIKKNQHYQISFFQVVNTKRNSRIIFIKMFGNIQRVL